MRPHDNQQPAKTSQRTILTLVNSGKELNMTNHPQRMVDMRIPLPYLISAVCLALGALGSTVWTVAGQSNDLKLLVVSSAKMEKRLEEGVAKADSRQEEMRDRFANVDRTMDNLKLRVDALERMAHK